MSLETELKLYIAPEDCSKLLQHPLLQSSHTQTKQLYNSYFDTAKHDLLKQGIGLRVRHIGKKRIQTIKTAGKAFGGLHKRQEWENEITADTPDYSKFPKEALININKKNLKQVEIIFSTDFKRTTWDLRFENSQIEVALDEGTVKCQTAETPISEVELELKAGTPEQLYKVALILQKDIPLNIENKSKAERGYTLHKPKTPTFHKAGSVELPSNLTAEQAFIHIISYCLSHLQANQDIVLYGKNLENIEGVHQMRVALRRLRSCLNLYKPIISYETHTEIRQEIKWISDVLGIARDWDVFAQNLKQIQEPILKILENTIATHQAQAYIEVRQAMHSQRYTRLLLLLGQWLTEAYWRKTSSSQNLDSPIKDLATTILNKHYQRVSKQGKNLSQLNSEELHNLRISIKKLAYGTRFFTNLYPLEATRAYAKILSDLQDELGILNDNNVANELLDKAEIDNNAPARYFLKGWHTHQEMTHKKVLKKAWESFLETKLYWLI